MSLTTKKLQKNLNRYWTLIKRFPLRPIVDDEQHKQAIELIKELAMNAERRSADEVDYLSVLSRLIADYEQTKPSIQKFLQRVRQVSPTEALKFLMEESKTSQTQLAWDTGLDQGNLSAFLAGRRKLSSAAALKLAKHFAVSTDLFLSRQ
jgi:antitoxin component HigA of HigAB toxin-antitoxin module